MTLRVAHGGGGTLVACFKYYESKLSLITFSHPQNILVFRQQYSDFYWIFFNFYQSWLSRSRQAPFPPRGPNPPLVSPPSGGAVPPSFVKVKGKPCNLSKLRPIYTLFSTFSALCAHFLGGKKFKSQNPGVGKISKYLNFIYQCE